MYDLQLRRLREAAGLTQRELADRLDGVTMIQVSNWELGKSELRLKEACILADFFDVTLDELAGNEVVKAPERIARAYSQLDPVGQARAEAYMDGLSEKT